MGVIDILSSLLLLVGAFFYLAGTVGLLRFPDVYTRLHALTSVDLDAPKVREVVAHRVVALTKADNLGLGCVALGLALQAESLAVALKILLVWPLVLAASAAVSFAIARRAQEMGIEPWGRDSNRS